MSAQRITILGSTGSIGVSTLDVIRCHRQRYEVFALCAHSQMDRLFDQCLEFRPRYAVIRDAKLACQLQHKLNKAFSPTKVEYGQQALVDMAEHPEVDSVMAAIVGAAGLPSAMAAARAGKKIMLANKEALVMAGALFIQEVKDNGAMLLPIDSEHNAIFQSLPVGYDGKPQKNGISKILLTASGGPFRKTLAADLEKVTPEQACAHPKWAMGRKISVDSATMMNKALEVIEARWLFNVLPEQIEVIIHPESIIHSMVQYIDGSVIAGLGNPDMRIPIAHALAYPERIASGVEPLDFVKVASLHFEAPDHERFLCLALAYRALDEGGSSPVTLNAANEVVVQAFLDRKIAFTAIPNVVAAVMDKTIITPLTALEGIVAADQAARALAEQIIRQYE